jgi:hypothetical protein
LERCSFSGRCTGKRPAPQGLVFGLGRRMVPTHRVAFMELTAYDAGMTKFRPDRSFDDTRRP